MPNKHLSFVDELKQASKAISDALEKYHNHSSTEDSSSTSVDSTTVTDHPVQDTIKHHVDEMKTAMPSFSEKLKDMLAKLGGKPDHQAEFHFSPEVEKFVKSLTEHTLNLFTTLGQAFTTYFSELAAMSETVKHDMLKDKQEPVNHQA